MTIQTATHLVPQRVLARLLAVCLPSAALAAPVPAPALSPPPAAFALSDSVHCVYDQMSPEDREMSLLLFEREVAAGKKYHAGSRNLKVIDRLINEAGVKCAQPYGWSRGRSDAAIGYAMNALMNEGIGQALEAKGHAAAPIDVYFTKHRSELAGNETIEGAASEAFRAYLIELGWAKGETETFGIAEFYLESLLTRDRQTRSFAAAAPHPVTAAKPAAKPRPYRAKTARRGKP